MKKILLGASFLALLSTGVFAQDLPGALRGIDGVKSLDIQEGIEIFDFSESDFMPPEGMVVGRAEGQGDLFIGFFFDETGDDVGAAMQGIDPIRVRDVLERKEDAEGNEAEVSSAGDASTGWSAALLDPGLAPAPAPAPASPAEDGSVLAMTSEELQAELVRLQGEIANSSTPEQMAGVLREWQERMNAAEIPVTPAPEASISAEPAEASTNSAPVGTPLEAAEVAPVSPAVTAEGEPAELSADAAYDMISRETAHFIIGAETAPIVYAFIDPQCPFCSRALDQMLPQIQNGQYRLAVIPVAAVKEDSTNAVAGMMLSENPAETLFGHARAKISGGTDPLVLRPFTDLPPEVQEDVRQNTLMLKDLGVSSVPFFAFQTAGGPRAITGVPGITAFDEAVQ